MQTYVGHVSYIYQSVWFVGMNRYDKFKSEYTKADMNAQTSHKTRQRKTHNDVFITPKLLAKQQVHMVLSSLQNDKNDNTIWYDPFTNSGNYFY